MKALRKWLSLIAMFVVFHAIPAASESPNVSLSDYVFDFPKYGYEITVTGTTSNYSDKLAADDHITIIDDGYSLKTLVDRMGRKDRQRFISFFNGHCIGFTVKCNITATGDVELDKGMRMIFRVSTAKISSGGNEWSNKK